MILAYFRSGFASLWVSEFVLASASRKLPPTCGQVGERSEPVGVMNLHQIPAPPRLANFVIPGLDPGI